MLHQMFSGRTCVCSPYLMSVVKPGCRLSAHLSLQPASSLCYFVWAIGSEMSDPISPIPHSHSFPPPLLSVPISSIQAYPLQSFVHQTCPKKGSQFSQLLLLLQLCCCSSVLATAFFIMRPCNYFGNVAVFNLILNTALAFRFKSSTYSLQGHSIINLFSAIRS